MRYEEIDALIRRFEESSLSVMEYEEKAYRIRLEQAPEEEGGIGPSADRAHATAAHNHVAPAVAAEEVGAPATGIQMTDAPASATQNNSVPESEAIRSPLIGTFYSAPSPEEPSFVEDGDMVKRGDVLGIVEAMKVMNEIKAPYDCRIAAVRATDGAMVEVGSALFEVEPC